MSVYGSTTKSTGFTNTDALFNTHEKPVLSSAASFESSIPMVKVTDSFNYPQPTKDTTPNIFIPKQKRAESPILLMGEAGDLSNYTSNHHKRDWSPTNKRTSPAPFPEASNVTEVMAAVNDQNRAVAALKDAVNAVTLQQTSSIRTRSRSDDFPIQSFRQMSGSSPNLRTSSPSVYRKPVAPSPPLFRRNSSTELLHSQIEVLTKRVLDMECKWASRFTPQKDEVFKMMKKALNPLEHRIEAIETRLVQLESKLMTDRIGLPDLKYQLAQTETMATAISKAIPELEAKVAHLTDSFQHLQSDFVESTTLLEATSRNLDVQVGSVANQVNEFKEAISILQGRFDFQLTSITDWKAEISSKIGGNAKEVMDSIKPFVTGLVQSETEVLQATFGSKVDTAVLEELMHHLATRDELKKMFDKVQSIVTKRTVADAKSRSDDKAILMEQISSLRREVNAQVSNSTSEMKTFVRQLDQNLPGIRKGDDAELNFAALATTLEKLETRIQRQIAEASTPSKFVSDDALEKIRENVLDHVHSLLAQYSQHTNGDVFGTPSAFAMNKPAQTALNQLAKDFDDKLYTLCKDLSACKSAYESASRQPFYRCAQWIWSSSSLQLGSYIPWNYESTNTDPQNFLWEPDTRTIKIQEPGFYEISFAVFDISWKPSIQVVVNGESVMSALHSPSYVVRHSSGFIKSADGRVRAGTVTGLSLLDFLSLPAKSSISLHYHGGKKDLIGHGFLGIRRL